MKKHTLRMIICALLLAGTAIAATSCSTDDNTADTENPVTEAPREKVEETAAPIASTAPTGAFTVAETSYTFDKLGQYGVLTASVGDTAVYDVTYTSADENVAVVAGNTLMAVGNGTTTVTAARGDEEVIIMVNVSANAAVTIDGADMVSLNTGSAPTAALTASVSVPTVFDSAEAGVTWSSNNPAVATVDANGVVTAVGSGVAQITATSNYQISTTTTQSIMGMTITDTENTIAEDVITVMVNNEFDESVHADIIGKYEGHYDWQGFHVQASADNPCYTAENFQWIRSKITLELKEDGSFTQQVLNAQRATYPESIDESLPESTYEEQVAKYGKNFCYVYNPYDQDPAADEFKSETDKTFASIVGMETRGMNNFSENGYYMILDGELILFFGQVNGFTGEYESKTFNYGPAANGEYVNNVYTPFTNLVAMSDNMSVVLEKAE